MTAAEGGIQSALFVERSPGRAASGDQLVPAQRGGGFGGDVYLAVSSPKLCSSIAPRDRIRSCRDCEMWLPRQHTYALLAPGVEERLCRLPGLSGTCAGGAV